MNVRTYLSAHPSHAKDAECLSEDGRTPLHCIAGNRASTLAAVKLVMQFSPSALNVADDTGKTPLIYAREREVEMGGDEVSASCFRLLLASSVTAERDPATKNNQLHQVLWAYNRTAVTEPLCLHVCKVIIEASEGKLLHEPNDAKVTPLAMSQSCFSKDIQSTFRIMDARYTPQGAEADALTLLAGPGSGTGAGADAAPKTPSASPKGKKRIPSSSGSSRKMTKRERMAMRWSTAPDYDNMETKVLRMKRILYKLHLAVEKERKRLTSSWTLMRMVAARSPVASSSRCAVRNQVDEEKAAVCFKF